MTLSSSPVPGFDFRSLPKLQGSEFLPGAHHPHCTRHANHLIWIRGRPHCLGCFCMALGAWGGIALASLPAWREVSFTGWLLGHAVLVAPTVCQPWFQWKPYKIAARWLLGAACASWVIGAIEFPHMPEPAWVTRALCLAWMFIASRVLLKIRERKTRNPCLDCPLGVYPTCEWNLPRLLAENQDEGLNEALRVTHGRAELAPSVE